MSLFVAQHQRPPETCPAAHTSGFLDHVSATAARYRVAIQAEAMIDGEHRLGLIAEAADRADVERFMALSP